MISLDPLAPGSVYTSSVDDHAKVGLYRLEVGCSPGTGKLKIADGVFISQVARLAQIPKDQRLNPERVVAAIAKAGRPAFYEQNAEAIVDRIVPMLRSKDVVVVFSNGGFDNIHEKLLTRLREQL